jgi:AcrR family transcriptional regulator
MGDAAKADGRTLRRARNQDAVVEAILDLLLEGHVQPTAQQVSARSGVSMRTIFRLFDDMEALHRIAIARQTERIGALLAPLPVGGPTADRVAALVADRAKVFEAITPVRRLAVRLASGSAALSEELARAAKFFRDQLVIVLRPELGDRRSGPVVEALDLVTSWEAWERLRAGQGLAPAAAREAMTAAITALLTTTEIPGEA